jgi:sulfate permease, SulP family
MGALLPSTIRDDLFGGLVSGVLAIPLAMGFGMFAFTALGDRYFAHVLDMSAMSAKCQ